MATSLEFQDHEDSHVDFVTTWLRRAQHVVPSVPLPSEQSFAHLKNSLRVNAVLHGDLVGTMACELKSTGPWKPGAWINVGQLASEDSETTEAMYAVLATKLFELNVQDHYVWLPADHDLIQPWLNLGFHYMHARGVQAVATPPPTELPSGYVVTSGGIEFLRSALELDAELEAFQAASPSFALSVNHENREKGWRETLEDPTVTHAVAMFNDEVVGQALTYELTPTVGVAPRTVQLSAVAVTESHRAKGLGTALKNFLMTDAQAQAMDFMETNWRVSNRLAAGHWAGAGFPLTYMRLHREIGAS